MFGIRPQAGTSTYKSAFPVFRSQIKPNMKNPSSIRLLATGNNERGDLLTRLTKDLFFALGFDDLRLNVHKSGREVDLQGLHRLEPRRVIAECKAHAAKMGGADLNKFFGVLGRERKKYAPIPVVGYFVSLGGFTETAIDQETETGDDRVILVTAERVVAELESCRVVVGRTDAVERSGHCAQHAKLQDTAWDGTELLGHERGYLWAVFYARGKERTHFALIHADGTPLAETVALEVIEADRRCGGSLHSLQYLAPPGPAPDRMALAAKVASSYRQWLGEECGYIQLDGLPADTVLSATRLKLERLFVPLRVNFLPEPNDHSDLQQTLRNMILPVGVVLDTKPHLALLAMPGGGKSTLLKRLATAYAFPERRGEVSDDLPQRDWLPLILRCRELRDRAHRPIIELLDDIPLHAGMDLDECSSFRESTHAALRNGQALLLIDGLDEISDEGARQTFANHLRTFIAMFPQASLVVTSREAGFRLVAGVVASACHQVKLAPFDEADVLSLCERWHVEVLGDSEKVRAEAKELGRTIWDNQRIRMLSENPLLLTTLLVVKRNVGELPRSRTALYREAIRVLVRTWNVEGYAPLDKDETLAQLSYVACAMMEEGKQQIGHKDLLKLLQSSRQELEAELQFARISPQEFIERIEYRSSLVMQTGHERIDGLLQPVYEFRHLTFQEYLAARGFVEEQYPRRELGHSLADVLERYFDDESWREVIPLAAVLAGRKAEELIRRLTSFCQRYPDKGLEDYGAQRSLFFGYEEDYLGGLLSQCIRDEVQVTAPTLRSALRELASNHRKGRIDRNSEWIAAILRGKFGAIFQEEVEHTYLDGGAGIEEYIPTLATVSMCLRFGDQEPAMSDGVATSLLKDLETSNRLEIIRAALVSMKFIESYADDVANATLRRTFFEPFVNALIRMLTSGDLPSSLAACWASALFADNRTLAGPPQPEMLLALFRLWSQLESEVQAHFPAWAFAAQQVLPRDTFENHVWGDCDLFLHREIVKADPYRRKSALIVGWYRRSPWSDAELIGHVTANSSSFPDGPRLSDLLRNLGPIGQSALVKLKNDRRQRGSRSGGRWRGNSSHNPAM